jgi:hypothetical protein
MIQKLYQLCDIGGEEWAMILTTAGLDKVQEVWSKVIADEEYNEEVDNDPVDRLVEELQVDYPDTSISYIAAYVKP